ncbi:hypothetical protein Hamer_G010730 [Homarus americanus]|uniref:Uncharacterized protein n=1 Tax=Homarus americanus TaxID=6706 RepID=A0A8J5JQ84_HOMAM|nr:hypothetical protein Hamer_G010730 [Homarus americanus]
MVILGWTNRVLKEWVKEGSGRKKGWVDGRNDASEGLRSEGLRAKRLRLERRQRDMVVMKFDGEKTRLENWSEGRRGGYERGGYDVETWGRGGRGGLGAWKDVVVADDGVRSERLRSERDVVVREDVRDVSYGRWGYERLRSEGRQRDVVRGTAKRLRLERLRAERLRSEGLRSEGRGDDEDGARCTVVVYCVYCVEVYCVHCVHCVHCVYYVYCVYYVVVYCVYCGGARVLCVAKMCVLCVLLYYVVVYCCTVYYVYRVLCVLLYYVVGNSGGTMWWCTVWWCIVWWCTVWRCTMY